MRRLALNGMAWARGREVPETGFKTGIIGTHAPNNSGFGDKFKARRKPTDF